MTTSPEMFIMISTCDIKKQK